MLLVLATLKREAIGLTKVLRQMPRDAASGAARVDLAVLGGTGPQAAHTTTVLLEAHKPDAVVSLGFAGALNDALREGDLVVGSRVVFWSSEAKYPSWLSSNEALLQHARKALEAQGIPYQVGDVITTWKAAGSPSEKSRLGATVGAQVVDMEGSWIATVAEVKRVPFLLVRAVVDRTSSQVPGLVARLTGLPTWAQWMGAGLLCLFTPWNISALLRLRSCSATAAVSLARFLEAFLGASQRKSAQEPGEATIVGEGR